LANTVRETIAVYYQNEMKHIYIYIYTMPKNTEFLTLQKVMHIAIFVF